MEINANDSLTKNRVTDQKIFCFYNNKTWRDVPSRRILMTPDSHLFCSCSHLSIWWLRARVLSSSCSLLKQAPIAYHSSNIALKRNQDVSSTSIIRVYKLSKCFPEICWNTLIDMQPQTTTDSFIHRAQTKRITSKHTGQALKRLIRVDLISSYINTWKWHSTPPVHNKLDIKPQKQACAVYVCLA